VDVPADVQAVITERCTPCHSASPTQPGIGVAPKGIMFDDAADIIARRAQIGPAVETEFMPLGNITGMTDAERALVVEWATRG